MVSQPSGGEPGELGEVVWAWPELRVDNPPPWPPSAYVYAYIYLYVWVSTDVCVRV